MISLELQAMMVAQMLLSVFLGMVIGMERENHQQPAGMRTHMLVSLGSCMFTALSLHAFGEGDHGRVAAQIVTGIGFLGAGTIIVRKGSPHHLTTAASIWSTSAVGMAVGAGAWLMATAGALMIWFVLGIVRRWTKANGGEPLTPPSTQQPTRNASNPRRKGTD